MLYFSGFYRETEAKEFGFKQRKIFFKTLACVIMEAGKTKTCSLDSTALRLETQGNSLCCSSNQSANPPTAFLLTQGRLVFFFFLGLQLTG